MYTYIVLKILVGSLFHQVCNNGTMAINSSPHESSEATLFIVIATATVISNSVITQHHMHTNINWYILICTYLYIYTHKYILIHTYSYIYTHTYTYHDESIYTIIIIIIIIIRSRCILTLSLRSLLAPCSTKYVTMSPWPLSAAFMRAVLPYCSL